MIEKKLKNKKMKSKVLGVLAGIAAGAVLGVLFAPDKGRKTRKKIKSKSVEAKDNLKEEFDGFLNSVSKKYEALVVNGKEIVSKQHTEEKKELSSK
jgi:gas vesicle protein